MDFLKYHKISLPKFLGGYPFDFEGSEKLNFLSPKMNFCRLVYFFLSFSQNCFSSAFLFLSFEKGFFVPKMKFSIAFLRKFLIFSVLSYFLQFLLLKKPKNSLKTLFS